MATPKTKPFRTILDPPISIPTPTGSEYEDVLAMKITEDGKEEFYISGQTNVYESIQAQAPDTRIENIISKVIATGDITILQKKQGHFIDLTEMPKDIFEAQAKVREAETTFQQLPISVKEAYNNNFNEYLADVGSDKWLEIVGLKEKAPETDPEQKGEEE